MPVTIGLLERLQGRIKAGQSATKGRESRQTLISAIEGRSFRVHSLPVRPQSIHIGVMKHAGKVVRTILLELKKGIEGGWHLQ